MLRNYFLINLLLIIIVSFLGMKFYETFRATAGIPVASEIKQEKEKNEAKKRATVFNESSYRVITQKDLFKPSRSASEKKDDKTNEKAPPQNPPKLFGTIILNNEKTAILQDSESKATKTYKLNELISGYTISEIMEDKVVLEKNGENFEVKLREDKGIKPPARRTVQQNRSVKKPAQRKAPRQRRPRRVRRNVPTPPKTAPDG